MADEKLEKQVEEEEEHDLYDPTLKPDELYFGMTKAEVQEHEEEQEAMAESYYEEQKQQAEWEKKRLESEKLKLLEIQEAQEEDGKPRQRDWDNAPRLEKQRYFDQDFPNFTKTIRTEILQLTLEAMGYSIGVSKNQMARLEAGGSIMTPSNMLLMFDQVEKYLIRENLEWYSLGEYEVDFLIPDMYKKLRGWCFGRPTPWPYSLDGKLIIDNAIPPLLSGQPHLEIPESDPDKFDKVFSNRTKEERKKIESGELPVETYEQAKYIEDAREKVLNSPKKKPKEVVVGWAVVERNIDLEIQKTVSQEVLTSFQNEIDKLTRKVKQQEGSLVRFASREKELQEELNRTSEKLDTAQKMAALYEHQMRHNKAMADKGLVNAIIGLPTPPPGKLTVDDIDDIPEEVQEKIYQDWQEEHLKDLAADAQMEDAKFERDK